MVTIDKETLNEWINVENLSYVEIGRRLSCSISYIKKYATKLGIELPIRTKRRTPSWNKGKSKKYFCEYCGKEITKNKGVFRRYCSCQCSANHRSETKSKEYLENQEEYKNKDMLYKWLKPFILKEQNNKCDICGLGTEWNGKELHFILDHIDGDAMNNKRENLRLICPNCDSQLDTFKSRNRGKSTRKYKPHKIKIS